MDYKKPLTIDEQIEYLKENKRIVFNDLSENDAKDILLTHGYINIIFHNNSLTILMRYYDIKNKSLRSRTDQRRYKNIIEKLLV